MKSRFVLTFMLAWSALLAASLLWNWREVDHSVIELAQKEAQSHFEKDVLFRRWVALRGGVYVTPTEKTPPNPHLAFMPDRDVTTTSGKKLTLINPAYLTRQVYELAAEQHGIQGHITSLKPLRPENQPDDWEKRALLALEAGAKEIVEVESLGGEPHLRFMRPLMTEAACLKCHEAQGYKIGDIRGGISIAVPFTPFTKIAESHRQFLLLGHLAIGALGLTGFWIGSRRLLRSEDSAQHAQKKMERLAEQQDLLLTCMAEGIYGVDSEGKCIFINPSALSMIGLREDDVIGRDQHQLFHSRKHDGSPYPHEECPIYLTLQDGQKRETEEAFLHSNGQLFPVRLAVTPMLKNEKIVGAVVAFQNIAEHKQAENRLREASRYTRSLIEASLDPLVTISTDGKITDVNLSTEEVTGCSRNELIGTDFSSYFTEPEQARAGYQSVFAEGMVKDYPLAIRHRDGRITEVLYNASVYRNATGEVSGVFAAARDITERKRMEEQLRELNTTLDHRVQEEVAKNLEQERLLIQQSRLATMGEMIGNIAHQWRQPLNALGLLIANIKDAYDYQELDEKALEESVAKGRQYIEKMSTTIDDFRNFFKPNKQKVDFNLRKAIEDTLSLVSHGFKNNNITVSVEGEDVVAHGFPNEFTQVMLNLLNNAKDALLERNTPHGQIEIRLGSNEDNAFVTIKDNAGGIPDDILPKIFDPYFTTKEKGTGIGLYMSRMIMEHMDGSVVASNLDGKAEFKLVLPKHSP